MKTPVVAEHEEPKNVYYIENLGVNGGGARKHQSLKTRNKLFVPVDLMTNSQQSKGETGGGGLAGYYE